MTIFVKMFLGTLLVGVFVGSLFTVKKLNEGNQEIGEALDNLEGQILKLERSKIN